MTDPVTVHLMRHGEPTLTGGSLGGRLLGRTDCPATPAGIAAAHAAAARYTVDAVVCSDLRRAVDCVPPPHVPRIDPRWRELDFGAWDGLPAGAVDPALLARFHDDPDAAPPPGGERRSALVARVAAALGAITMPTLVVTHAGAMRAALSAACGFDAHQVWAFDLPYACVLSLRLWPGDPPMGQITALHA